MVNLEIKSGPISAIRKGIGVFNFILAIFLFILFLDSRNILYILLTILVILNGFYLFTSGFGLEKSWIRVGTNFLIIKWSDRLRQIKIHNSAITKICLERLQIVIHMKYRKPLKLKISYLENDQKNKIYRFFIDYANQKNLSLERHVTGIA